MSYGSRVYRHRNPKKDEDNPKKGFFKKNTQAKEAKAPAFFQAKLTVNEPGDSYEKEADAVADAVTDGKQTDTNIRKKKISSIQRLSTSTEEEKRGTNDERMRQDKEIQEKHEEEEDTVQKKGEGGTTASGNISSSIDNASGKGSSLPKKSLGEMNSSFGANFSRVRVHTDSEAETMNEQLKAKAFTHGKDIFFAKDNYDPDSSEGKKLLAHELTHVVQQEGMEQTEFIHKKPKAEEELETGMTVSNQKTDNPYGWTSSYGLEVTKSEVRIVVGVRIVPDADVTAAQVKKVKTDTALEFSRYFDQRFNLTDDKGQSRILKVRLNYVEAGENAHVTLHSGAGRDNLSNWFVDSSAIDRAHEMGHQIGLLDEYVDPAAPNRATGASAGVHTDNSIMGNYPAEGVKDADVRQRHGDALAADISAATGTQFAATFSDTYVVRRGDNLSWIAQRIYGDTGKWRDIFNLNKKIIRDPNLIFPGQKLKLPPR